MHMKSKIKNYRLFLQCICESFCICINFSGDWYIWRKQRYKRYGKEKQKNHKNLDIKDPWGFDRETYKFCAQELVLAIEKIIEKEKILTNKKNKI